MRNTKVLFTVSLFAGVGVAVGVGCGSSKSSGGTPVIDAAMSDDGSPEASGGPGSGCGPIGGGATTCEPGMGLTCCIDLSNAITAFTSGGSIGTCQTAASCTQSIQYECLMPTDCGGTGMACCGAEMGDAGALTAALADASVGDASFDAAGLGAVDAAAITSLFSGLSFQANCATSCNSTQFTLCSVNSDCAALPGYVCAAPPASLFGGAAGGAGGGALGGLSLGSVVMINICQLPTPDSGTVSDAGSHSDAATDAGTTTTSDAATDAGTTESDAATDAPTGG